MILADTSFLIALIRANDENHKRAKEIAESLKEQVILTDHVFGELITFLARKDGRQTAYECGTKLLQSELSLVFVFREDLQAGLEYVKKYPLISMCDAVSVVIMKKLGVKKVLSFDSDFDRLGCERIS